MSALGQLADRVALVAQREYLRTVRRRGFALGTLLVPLGAVLLLAASGFVSSGLGTTPAAEGDLTIYLVNQSALHLAPVPTPAPTPRPAPGASLAEASPFVPIRLVGLSTARHLLDEHVAQEIYVLTPDYLSSGTIDRLVPSQALDLAALDRQQAQIRALGTYLRMSLLQNADLPPQVVRRLLAPGTIVDRTSTGSARPAAAPGVASFLVPYVFSLLFLLSIFMTSGYLLQSVTEEKENRVVEIVLSSVPPVPLMAGKIIGLGGAGLTQVGVWLATGFVILPLAGSRLPALGQLQIGLPVLAIAVCYFVLGYAAFGAIFSAIGAIAPGTREAQQYSSFLGILGAVPLMFTGAFLTDPHSLVATVLTLIPVTAPASALQVLALEPQIPWLLIGTSLALLAGFAVLATIASARVFRATLLLYGVRPNLRQIADAVLARG